jgi:cbb3-type cytochrome oxidase cytochrome c subunit
MNYGPLIFLAAFFALATSWFGLVLSPQSQLGRMQQTTNIAQPTLLYPPGRPGLARQGLDVYRANGCAYCHSQQVRQRGTVCDLILSDAGTNPAPLISALVNRKLAKSESGAKELLTGLPKAILSGVTKTEAARELEVLKKAGAQAELWIVPVGPEIARDWGKRRTVAEDFLYDSPTLLGSQRIGPDLANVGARKIDSWQYLHLYAPRSQVRGSVMPPYRYLFEERRIKQTPSPNALILPPEVVPQPGYEIVPKPEAVALVAYLASLRVETPLYAAPLSVPVPVIDTNAPAVGGTNVVATNAPAK